MRQATLQAVAEVRPELRPDAALPILLALRVPSVVYADDLQNPDDQDRDKFLLQRLPTLGMAALPAAAAESLPVLSRIIPSFDAEYTYFVPRRAAP